MPHDQFPSTTVANIYQNMQTTNVVSAAANTDAAAAAAAYERVVRVFLSGKAVVLFTIDGCSMCHVVKQLLFGLGVAPTILELDGGGGQLHSLLCRISGQRQLVVPAVFVGGRFFGGVESVMASHINATLVPLLKDVGALWL